MQNKIKIFGNQDLFDKGPIDAEMVAFTGNGLHLMFYKFVNGEVFFCTEKSSEYSLVGSGCPNFKPEAMRMDIPDDLSFVYDLFKIGENSRTPSILRQNIENAIRRADCLDWIEREFFTEVMTDEEEPYEHCQLSWGDTPEHYSKTFGEVLKVMIDSVIKKSNGYQPAESEIKKTITPMFGNQNLFKFGPPDAEMATDGTTFYKFSNGDAFKFDTEFDNGEWIKVDFVGGKPVAMRHIEEVPDSHANVSYEFAKSIHLSAKIIQHMIAGLLEENKDEMSKAVENIISNASACMAQPKRWTAEDQKAGRMPDVGAACMKIGCTDEREILAVTDRYVCIGCKDNHMQPYSVTHGEFIQYYHPIETPDEKAARLENEFIDSMVKELKVSIGSVSYQIVRSAIRHSYRKLSSEPVIEQTKVDQS